MMKLLSTTALVVALGLPTLTLAQTQAPAANPEHQQNASMPGFLDQRSQSDLFASELMGQNVYSRTTATNMTNDNTGMQGMATMTSADLDGMDNIGQINDIVLSNDGQVRALVIGAGGFLGMGEQDIAVTMDQVTFASDADDRSEIYIIVNMGSDMLQEAPAYDRTAMRTNATQDSAAPRADQASNRTAFPAPQIERDGFNQVEATEVSTEMLTGKSVYDVNDNDVGTVVDMLIDDEGAITNVIIDFGGFLGIGSSQASLNYDELTILSNDGYSEVRLYVDATEAQIRDLPQHAALN